MMSKHRVPPWINGLWLAFVLAEIAFCVVVALRRGCGFVQATGFLMASFGLIFMIAVAAGLALYGLSILLEGIEFHKSQCDEDDHSGDMANLIP